MAMAFSLTSHCLFSTSPHPSSTPYPSLTSKPSKTLVAKPLPIRPLLLKPIASFHPSLNCSTLPTRHRFKAHRNPSIINEELEDRQDEPKAPDSEAAHKSVSSLYTTVRSYRQAILDEDEKTIADIEALIYTVENEKNDLVEKVSSLSDEITAGKEKYIRLQADFDNFRKRSEKDRLTTRTDAQGEVIESLLPMVDNFERAKQQIKPETDMEKKIDTSYQGIYKQFVEIMRSLRVASVATVGKPFDPALHEAIAREESEEFREGIVIQEFRRGFLLGERLLRPAMVKVSAGPGRKRSSTTIATQDSVGQPAAAGLDER